MMSSKSAILSSIRNHTAKIYPKPSLSELEQASLTFADPVAQFSKALEAAGGRAVVLQPGQTAGEAIASLYPEAQRIANTVEGLDGADRLPKVAAVFNPDTVELPAELNGTDVAILHTPLAVAENACCWIEQREVRHRAVFFIAEALVILLRKGDIVNNMHEAYKRLPDDREVPYGCFISGPSKTADIEQALVFGAHGAREVTVLIAD